MLNTTNEEMGLADQTGGFYLREQSYNTAGIAMTTPSIEINELHMREIENFSSFSQENTDYAGGETATVEVIRLVENNYENKFDYGSGMDNVSYKETVFIYADTVLS
jgi:hypothetical protein